jgi:hypothetical protein
MIVTFDGGDGAATVVDVATRQPMFATDGSVLHSNFSTFAPDGATFLATYQGAITLRDSTTGQVLTTLSTGTMSTHPDFSPMGDKIVWASHDTGADWSMSGGGRLYTQTYDAATMTFGPPVLLVDVPGASLRAYYPTFSPDGQWVLYNVSDEDGYDDGNARMYVVKADGTVPPMLVASADKDSGLTNSWARWAPFQQETGGAASEPLFWFTVSSKREFGVRKPKNGRPQVWMAPFFPQRAAAVQDPTLPMFWLPFQNLGGQNHIAQWTEQVVPVQ